MGVMDIKDFKTHTDRGVIITNPPHGHRMSREEALRSLYRSMGDMLKNNYILACQSRLKSDIEIEVDFDQGAINPDYK